MSRNHESPVAPSAGRRVAMRRLGSLGLAAVAAFGLAAAPETRAKKKGKGKGGATPGPQGPQGPAGAPGAPGPSSGAFRGLVTAISATETIPSTSSRIATARCPNAAPGERVVATGGGFDAATFDLKIQFSQLGDDGVSWEVHAQNPTGSDKTFTSSVVCARYSL